MPDPEEVSYAEAELAENEKEQQRVSARVIREVLEDLDELNADSESGSSDSESDSESDTDLDSDSDSDSDSDY